MQGTFRADRQGLRAEVKPASGADLKCPRWLHKYGKEKWRELAPKLLSLGLLTDLDGESLALACQAWADWRLATETLNAEGQTVETTSRGDSRMKPHPAIGLAKDAWERWRKISALFGLNPSDRARVKAPGPTSDAVDPLQELLNRANDRGAAS